MVQSSRHSKEALQEWFDDWRKYAFGLRELRRRKEKTHEGLRAIKIRRALRKWNQRKEVTKKMRAICARGKLKK
jgi:hypothetical protein